MILQFFWHCTGCGIERTRYREVKGTRAGVALLTIIWTSRNRILSVKPPRYLFAQFQSVLISCEGVDFCILEALGLLGYITILQDFNVPIVHWLTRKAVGCADVNSEMKTFSWIISARSNYARVIEYRVFRLYSVTLLSLSKFLRFPTCILNICHNYVAGDEQDFLSHWLSDFLVALCFRSEPLPKNGHRRGFQILGQVRSLCSLVGLAKTLIAG